MKLFFSPASCSLSPHIVLHESGLKFETERVDLKTKQTATGDFLKINPKGYVPCLLLDSGETLTEGAVIVQYIADLVPDKRLLPKAGTMERYRAQEMLNFIATEVHKGFSPLWNKDAPDAVKQMALEKLMTRLNYLNTEFAGKEYALGAQYSVADAYLFTVLNWANYLKVDLSGLTHLVAYCDRIKKRPSTEAAMMAEGILK